MADREQARALELQAAQAVAAERAAASARVIRWSSTAGAVALAMAILVGGAGVSWGALGAGKAAARVAEVRTNLIPLDEKTRQYPLFLQYQGKGKYALANPNTGSVTMLDTRLAPDRQMITAMAAVLLAGAVAREARWCADPAGVSVIQPAILKGGSDDEQL